MSTPFCSPEPLEVSEPAPTPDPWYSWFVKHPTETALMAIGSIALIGYIAYSSGKPKPISTSKAKPTSKATKSASPKKR